MADRLAKVKALLRQKFDVRNSGEAKYFLGMEPTCNKEARTKLKQKNSTGELVRREDLELDRGTVQIYYDNQGAIRLLKHPIALQQSKHIDVIHHFARERVARKEVAFAYCKTEDMKADIMTKALSPD
ncbi:hypothetical protein KFL_012140030 [Klebsormidium nitens]|uniref:Reverse transcriptase Ty1/copia-type domain-containing protein n=1 Tax=Klebsormidium nitens TaxID=105231 RepID=A0A1Y1IUC0_KLENI|nr:hypothetical protein KFL_012140030 [Klebsormidium nitens]|eukprot:GAQ92941.1 hypothetical protein KFL_012140030 [Klebsormidium nitens]